LRLLIAGNLANTGYYLASKLQNNGIQVDLLMESNPTFESDPKNSGLLDGKHYPSWIKFYDKKRGWKKNIIKIMRKYDLILAATEYPIFAMFSLKPFIALATGSDIYELAQSNTLKGFLIRLAYSCAKIVIFTLPTQLPYIQKLNIKKVVFLPLFRRVENVEYEKENIKTKNKFIFFHPTNHLWRVKHNEIFLKAYIKLANSRNDIFLITINRGEDAKKSIELLKTSNIEGKYKILPSTLNQKELSDYYHSSDAIADQFGVGSFGFIGIEVLHIGKPLICYIDLENYRQLYGESPPVINSKNSEEMIDLLKKLIEDRTYYEKVCKYSHDWFMKFHDEDILIEKYTKLIEMINEHKNPNEIISRVKFI